MSEKLGMWILVLCSIFLSQNECTFSFIMFDEADLEQKRFRDVIGIIWSFQKVVHVYKICLLYATSEVH